MARVYTEGNNTRVVIDWGDRECSMSLSDARKLHAALGVLLRSLGAPAMERPLRALILDALSIACPETIHVFVDALAIEKSATARSQESEL